MGDRLVAHANRQKSAWPPGFYNAYYQVLTDYLEEINYAGTTAAPRGDAMAVAPACRRCAAARVIIGSGEWQRRGDRRAAAARTLKERLAALKELLDEELITQEEFDARRKEILAEV